VEIGSVLPENEETRCRLHHTATPFFVPPFHHNHASTSLFFYVHILLISFLNQYDEAYSSKERSLAPVNFQVRPRKTTSAQLQLLKVDPGPNLVPQVKGQRYHRAQLCSLTPPTMRRRGAHSLVVLGQNRTDFHNFFCTTHSKISYYIDIWLYMCKFRAGNSSRACTLSNEAPPQMNINLRFFRI